MTNEEMQQMVGEMWLRQMDMIHNLTELLDQHLDKEGEEFQKYKARVQQDAVPDGAEIIPFPKQPQGENDG